MVSSYETHVPPNAHLRAPTHKLGSQVVLCGDTCDASRIAPLAMDADVLIHEATNAYLPPLDADKGPRGVEKATRAHGHSTPVMAGQFAKSINAKRLILNHFSPRYKGDDGRFSVVRMMRIEEQVGLPCHCDTHNCHRHCHAL